MLPSLLLLPLTGGLFLFGVQRRPSPPRLIEMLALPQEDTQTAEHCTPTPFPLAPMLTVDQNLALAIGLLGMTMGGYFGIAFLRLLSVPGLLYLDLYFIRTAYTEWQTERRIGMATNDAVLATGLIATRQFAGGALFATFFFVSRKLQIQVEGGLAHDYRPTTTTIAVDLPSSDLSTVQPALVTASAKPGWQSQIELGALPLLTLSAISTPWLGIKRALAILLTNFGYDYRVTAPLSTVSYLKAAGRKGIWLSDGQILDHLQAVDVLVLAVDWDEQHLAALQADQTVPPVILRPNCDEEESATLIAQLQAEGHTVAYLSNQQDARNAPPAAAIWITIGDTPTTDAPVAAHVVLAHDQPVQLQQLFALTTAMTTTQKRGFYLALAPGLLTLGGIFFGRFGVVEALLVDYGSAAIGILNALAPQFQALGTQKGVQSGIE
jgi:hypothetical protein